MEEIKKPTESNERLVGADVVAGDQLFEEIRRLDAIAGPGRFVAVPLGENIVLKLFGEVG